MSRGMVGVVIASALVAAPLQLAAQSPPAGLQLQGTAAYNHIWNQSATPTGDSGTKSLRFSGRIALRFAPRAYAGVAMGSWEYATRYGASDAGGLLDSEVSTAVVVSSYAQWYPLARAGLFVRGGVGIASSRTYQPYTAVSAGPAGAILRHVTTRPSVTAGAGFDVAIRAHLAITLSGDFTTLAGAQSGQEARSALLAGVGLTVR